MTPDSSDTDRLARSTAARVAGSSTGLPSMTATMLGPLHRRLRATPFGVLEVAEYGAAHDNADREQHRPGEQYQATASMNPAPERMKHVDHLLLSSPADAARRCTHWSPRPNGATVVAGAV